jgi:hypothetical protein
MWSLFVETQPQQRPLYYLTGDYADPQTCTYYAYECTYCLKYFYLVQPKDKQAGGVKRTVQYRNPNTNEIEAKEFVLNVLKK